MSRSVIVKVPASSGNIGPGFDVLGLALNFYNELRVKELSRRPGDPVIIVQGEGEAFVSRRRNNIIYRSFARVFNAAGQKPPRVEMRCLNRIPLARGLGSSSAAIVSGLLAANQFLKRRYSTSQILDWATQIEGHPDNVAPALLGGVQASTVINGHVLTSQWKKPDLDVVVAVPHFQLETKKARAVLPEKISMVDAVHNLGAVAIMQEAFIYKTEWLKNVLNDCWHEPYRATLIPGFNSVKIQALRAGALGVTLSGAGPTILSFVPRKRSIADRVGNAMSTAFKQAHVHCDVRWLTINQKGSMVR